MANKLPTYFISHGGGPWPWVPQMREIFANLERSFVEMVDDLPQKPKAVLMISGHWEAEMVQVMASPQPPMVYDYGGFPAHTYSVVYPSPGAPEIAEKALNLLKDAEIAVELNVTQGYDHGTFVPMAIMYPQANVPLFQISLQASYDPATHLAMGRALAPLRDEGVLIVGSGLSYHNLRLFGPEAREPSDGFDAWLHDALMQEPDARTAAMIDWESAPYARVSHKQEDHLVPIFVALGAAEGEAATMIYHEKGLFGGVTASSYRFG
ncbi:DODA-type extradiol aromatic ring-opening family dioxygenase [Loktanella agnita]|uniref:DODA-type extradiol aromatic ring-opening family dioxygenase n=1 Tax=Loktanella agnita TaxID=287097 RepID=UPI0039889F6D